MIAAIDWLRVQPWRVRLTFAALFASMSLVGWLVGYVWPWGFVMALVPIVLPRRSSAEEVFYKPVRETDEVPPILWRFEVEVAALPTILAQLSGAVASGFGPEKVEATLEAVRLLRRTEERRFQYVVMCDGRPTTLQLTWAKIASDEVELQALAAPHVIAAWKAGLERAGWDTQG